MSEFEEQVNAVVFETLRKFGVEKDDIVPEATLEQINIDSLDLLELGQLVQEKLGVKIEPEQFKDVRTVGQATEAIVAAGSAAGIGSKT